MKTRAGLFNRMNRRDFLKTCCAAGAATAMGGNMRMAFSDTATSENVLVLIFLRGGCDGLSFFPPISGEDRAIYESSRPGLSIPLAGDNAAINLNDQFGLHPFAAPLKPIYDAGNLAVVRACGNLQTPSRSHFDAQAFLESGLVNTKNFQTGWLTRLFASLPDQPQEIVIPSVAATSYIPDSFIGDPYVLTMDDPQSFQLNTTHWAWDTPQLQLLPSLYSGGSAIEIAGAHAAQALQAMAARDFSGYTPEGGAIYPDTYFSNQLKTVAQLIKDDSAGMRVATVEFNGWDTHNGQDNADMTGWFSNSLVAPFSQSLAAFMADIGANSTHGQRATVVVQTEFGRRLAENGDSGTDHGYGSDMLLLGDAVNGGQFYGNWLGLAPDTLFKGEDVMATTDFRHVLSEVMTRRMGNPNLDTVFPGYSSYQPLGLVEGSDLQPQPPLNSLFSDGFEGAV